MVKKFILFVGFIGTGINSLNSFYTVVQAKQRGVRKATETVVVSTHTKRIKSPVLRRKKSVRKKKAVILHDFSLGYSSAERVKSAIMEQAHSAFSGGLQEVGVAKSEADSISTSIINLVKKGYELSEKNALELDRLTVRKKTLDKKTQKNVDEQHEGLQLGKQIDILLQEKQNGEKVLGALASTLSLSIAQMELGSETKNSITQLLQKIKISGVAYGEIASRVVANLFEGIKLLKKDSYVGALKKHMKYYLGASEESVGGWSFGQHLPTGKVYVRLDTPCPHIPGYMHVVHRELILKGAYPFRDINKQIAQIIAGKFELGAETLDHKARSVWVTIFG